MIVLAIYFLEKINITEHQAQLVADSICSKVEAMETGIEIDTDPFTISLPLESVFYTEQNLIGSIITSFEEINILTGKFRITLTESAKDDAELGTPPYFEEEIDVGAYYKQMQYVTLTIEFRKSKLHNVDGQMIGLSFSDAEINALSKELHVITENPILYYGEVLNTNKNILRLVFEAQPAENIPGKDLLKEHVLAAIEQSNVMCVSFNIGAYIKDWDNTLWQDEFFI